MSTSTITAEQKRIALVDQQQLVRTRLYVIARPQKVSDILDVLNSITGEKATGKISVNINQGHVQSIKFEESSQIFLDK